MKRIAIVILNWNGKEFLEKFLPGVIKHSSNMADIIIADNASNDGSVEFLRNNYPEIRIIRHNSNLGFAKGYNDALSQIESQYYILLNSDIEVTENWIKPIIDLMDSDRRIAACQPKILSYHQRGYFEYAGAAGGYIDKYGYPFCRGRVFQHVEEDKGQYDQLAEIFWASGACLFVRAEIYHRFSGFDDDFFAHMEEIDFCWRLKNAGYTIMYCPQSVVYHIGGGTLPKVSALKTYLNFRNNLTLIFKNIPTERLYFLLFSRWIFDLIAALKFMFEGNIRDAAAVGRAHLYFLRTFRKQLIKRRKISQSAVSGIYQRNVVIDYYLRKKQKFSDFDPRLFT